MMNLLIGHRGFVGSNLCLIENLKLSHFAGKKEIKNFYDHNFENIYCAAPQAKKWLANSNPSYDLNEINSLIENIRNIKCKNKFFLFSTIDVYYPTKELNEDASLDGEIHAYGKNRRFLEKSFMEIFKDKLHIIRLPALVGKGLKKNIIFDLIFKNNLNLISVNSKFQWFNLSYLEDLINICLLNNIKVLNVASEPIETEMIINKFFPKLSYLIEENKKNQSINYDIWTKYSQNKSKYLYSADEIFNLHLKNYLDSV